MPTSVLMRPKLLIDNLLGHRIVYKKDVFIHRFPVPLDNADSESWTRRVANKALSNDNEAIVSCIFCLRLLRLSNVRIYELQNVGGLWPY